MKSANLSLVKSQHKVEEKNAAQLLLLKRLPEIIEIVGKHAKLCEISRT